MKAFHPSYTLKYALILCFLLAPQKSKAQIVPDATLPINSIVTPNSNTSVIEGGTSAGSNLFHSFREFSIPTGNTAHFNNALTIQNILTRVTGSSISNIDGLIQANGSANLFFINPNGIIFGPNARLNIGGSFIASSANSIQLSDGNFFSATNPTAPPLLTVNVPIGLQLGPNPGAIRLQGTGHTLTARAASFAPIAKVSSDSGLRVSPGNTLALIGGDVVIEGGTVAAEGGQIELGSVGNGLVSLNPISSGWTLDYSGVQNFQKIDLSQQSLADVSGESAGSIQVVGAQISVLDGSVILIQNQGFKPSGSINVKATEFIEVSGITPDEKISSGLINQNLGGGSGGDIVVSTNQLFIQNRAAIKTETYSDAKGGNITAIAWDSLQLSGSGLIGAATIGSGDAGDITVNAGRLTVLSGGTVFSLTLATGDGGNVSFRVTDSIELIGVNPILFSPSSLAVTTFNAGNAGNLTIDTGKLVLRDGGRVDASTIATGNAGSVTINATDSIEVSGTVPGFRNPSLISSSAIIVDETLLQAFGLQAAISGAAGDVTINTPVLNVGDGAQVTVKNEGSGNAGTLGVNAGSILLNDRGSISASTTSGEGGNINLQVRDSLQLRNGSQISAEAGGTGNGGNLTINASVIAALENSDIIANAFQGKGGNIQISTQGILGADFSPQLTSKSDITASSQLGVSGIVTISNPEVNQNSALVELPQNLTDTTQQIVAGCAADKGNSFAIAGRGGLPENPSGTLRGATIWSDLRPLNRGGTSASAPEVRLPITHSPSQIVEATGIEIDSEGTVRLVAIADNITPQQPWQKNPDCGNL